MALGFCRECGGRASTEAHACPHCGAASPTGQPVHAVPVAGPLPPSLDVRPARSSDGLAAALSVFLPGTGQIYKGHLAAGLVWLLFTCLGYLALVLPGIVLHTICIVHAHSLEPAG
jgi:hypothetical protein